MFSFHLSLSDMAKRASGRPVGVRLLGEAFALAALGFSGASAMAAERGLYIQGDVNLAIGPGHVTVPRSTLLGGEVGGKSVFGLGNDGRFGFGGSVGYIYQSFGARLRYQSLGRQHGNSINGAGFDSGSAGLSARYIGVDGMYLLPIVPRKVDVVLTAGLGRLNTQLHVNGTAGAAAKHATIRQSELAMSLGVGVRIAVTKRISITSELNRLTPIQSGVRHRGYNTGYTVVSVGTAYRF